MTQVRRKIRFTWLTDLKTTRENAWQIMRAGRARGRIGNETFNTLKSQGHTPGHNYGLGRQHLSAVFAHLMMLAFLVDRVQQPCRSLHQVARRKCRSKRELRERIRSIFKEFIALSMQMILWCIVNGFRKKRLDFQWE